MRYGIKERNIGLAVLFTIITCGIYGLYWLYELAYESDIVTEEKDDLSPGLVLLLSIVTCGIFEMYWCYKMGEKFKAHAAKNNLPVDEYISILYLVLGIANYFVGVTMIVNYALMQDRINNIIRTSKGMDSAFGTRYAYTKEEATVVPKEIPADTSEEE